ncbi:endo-1,3-1,4-beta-glycanase [alpha proteobacterium U9-1i]|nr:endo-1,3-1,4-beta-glycanase [alpha proteobacterium U9-1i]
MIRRWILTLCLALACGAGVAHAQQAASARGALRLTFEDQFDRLRLRHGDTGVWSTTFGYDGIANRTLTSNRELQLYVEPGFTGTGQVPLGFEPFEIRQGVLRIKAARVPRRIARRMWNYRYASGLINTRQSFSQTYGYFEMRARLPEGAGMWPAFWLLPADGSWPPEIDVLEHLGRDPTTVYVGLKTNEGNDGGVQAINVPTATSAFHTYGVLWTREQVTWFIDGFEVRRRATPGDMHQPMYMLVNLAIGGAWAGSPNRRTPFPVIMEVDYVRAYALAEE